MASIEAMAGGMPVLGNKHPTSPIKHGVNGFLSDNPEELRMFARILLEDKELANLMACRHARPQSRSFRWIDLRGRFRHPLRRPAQNGCRKGTSSNTRHNVVIPSCPDAFLSEGAVRKLQKFFRLIIWSNEHMMLCYAAVDGKAERILKFIESRLDENSPPSQRELAGHFGLSQNAFFQLIGYLKNKGYLVDLGRHRGLRLSQDYLEQIRRAEGVPLVGRVAAGEPILASRISKDI